MRNALPSSFKKRKKTNERKIKKSYFLSYPMTLENPAI